MEESRGVERRGEEAVSAQVTLLPCCQEPKQTLFKLLTLECQLFAPGPDATTFDLMSDEAARRD